MSSIDLVERIRFAALKLSDGDLGKLEVHVRGDRHDWRDVLMAADFANSLTAHKQWMPVRSGLSGRGVAPAKSF